MYKGGDRGGAGGDGGGGGVEGVGGRDRAGDWEVKPSVPIPRLKDWQTLKICWLLVFQIQIEVADIY